MGKRPATQAQKFREAAKKAEATESEADFSRAVGKVVGQKRGKEMTNQDDRDERRPNGAQLKVLRAIEAMRSGGSSQVLNQGDLAECDDAGWVERVHDGWRVTEAGRVFL